MRNSYQKQKNSGSTLLIVIICLAFVGILGSLMLSVSMVNLKMKRVESNAKVNFYSCETALEEIKTGLEEITSIAIKEEYEFVLKNYVSYGSVEEAERNRMIREEVLKILAAKIEVDYSAIGTDSDATGINYNDIAAKFKNYLSSPDHYEITMSSLMKSSAVPYSFLFRNVKIVYNEDGYKTSITSDIRVTIPAFTFVEGTDTVSYSMEQPYEGYALAADGGIYSCNSIGENKITGDVYAGDGGITVADTGLFHNHKLTINGNQIITRGNIKVQDTARLTIGDSIRPLVWANNLMTETIGGFNTGLTTEMNINAICLIKDDLTLEGRNSKAVLTGAYVGYTGEHTALGSAIIINGSGSSMDLSGLSSLILAGRAHISIEGMNSDVNIKTGESLALKSNQKAYLIPGKYLFDKDNKQLLHNPVTQKDISTGGMTKVMIPEEDATSDIDYDNYLNAWPDQYEIAAKQTMESGISSVLRYYYLKFSSGKKADMYFADYFGKKSDTLQMGDAFTLGDITIPANNKIVAAGNVLQYASTTKTMGYIPGSSISYGDDGALDSAIANTKFSDMDFDNIYQGTVLYDKEVGNLTTLNSKITHLLSMDTEKDFSEAEKAVDTTILDSAISQVSSEISSGYTSSNPGFTYYGALAGNLWNSSDPVNKSFVVINGNAEIAANSYFNGVFIASGNIIIGEGATINGIIIAAGGSSGLGDVDLQRNVKIYGRVVACNNITLKEGCNITCMGNTSFNDTISVNDFLKDIFHLDGQLLWKIFKNPDVTVNITSSNTSDMVELTNLVTYENWRKNKD